MEQEQIIDAVRDWLDSDDWHYEYNAEHQVIQAGINLRGKIKSGKIIICFSESAYKVYVFTPISGDKDNLTELNKYLAMANYNLANGNFELDVRDGEIRYKTYVNCRGLESLPKEIIADSIHAACINMHRYGDGLAALAFGFSDADTEIQKAEGGFEAEDEEDEDSSEE